MSSATKRHVNRMNNRASTPKKVAAGGVVAALAIGGVGAASAIDKVTVEIDGKVEQVSTISLDKNAVLGRAGVDTKDGDLVEQQGDLGNGGKLVYRSAKPVTLIVDGEKKEMKTNAITVDELVKSLSDINSTDRIKAPSGKIPADGIQMEIVTAKNIVLRDGDKDAPMKVAAITVGDVLKQRGIELKDGDTVTPSADTKLANDMLVHVSRTVEKEVKETAEIPASQTVVEDPEMFDDERVVESEGALGKKETLVKVTSRDGQELARETLQELVLTQPGETIIRQGTKPRVTANAGNTGAAAPAAGYGVWDEIAQCESGGNWAIDSGNGFSGGLQFTDSTWAAYGGNAYSPRASGASREQQIAVAEKVQASQGWGAWPACTSKLGIR